MKKAIICLALIICVLTTAVSAQELIKTGVVIKIGHNTAVVNGEYKTLDVPAEIISGRTFVPLRFCTEALGASVNYIDASKTAVIKKDDITLELMLDKSVYKVNGELFESDVPPVLKNDRILVPVRVVSESLKTEVNWIEDAQIVTLGVLDNKTAVDGYLKNLF